MTQFYLTYSQDSITNGINLMDLNSYFVQAHSLKHGITGEDATLDFALCVKAENTGQLAYRLTTLSACFDSATTAQPPSNLNPPLLLWMKLGDESQWTIWTVKNVVSAPMDLGVGEANIYGLHVRLTLWKHSLSTTYDIATVRIDSNASIFIPRVPGEEYAPTFLTLDSQLPANVYVAVRGHKNLAFADFNPHRFFTANFSLTSAWQNKSAVSGGITKFDNGLFQIFLHVSDSTPFFPSVSDLDLSVGIAQLFGGSYEYLQTGIDYLGNQGRVSNLATVTLGGAPLVFSSPLTSKVGSFDSLGGMVLNPFQFSVEGPTYPSISPEGFDFRLASDGWVLSEDVTEPLLVSNNPLYGSVPPTNKMPPQNKELGHSHSTVTISLPTPLTKRRTVSLNLNLRYIMLGSLGSPIFFPLLGNAGLMFDVLGWKLYLSPSPDLISDWLNNKVLTSALMSNPIPGPNAVSIAFDWSLGFLSVRLSIAGSVVATLANRGTPTEVEPTFGVVVTNELPQYVFARLPDRDEANWSFTKVTLKAMDDSAGSNFNSGQSSSENSTDSNSQETGTDGSSSKGTDGSSSANDSHSENKSASLGVGTGVTFGESTAQNGTQSVSTLTFTYKDIPVVTTGPSYIDEKDAVTGGSTNHNVDANGNHIAMVGPLTVFPQFDSGVLITPAQSQLFPPLGIPQFGLLKHEWVWYLFRPLPSTTLHTVVSPTYETGLNLSADSPSSGSSADSDSQSNSTSHSDSDSGSGSSGNGDNASSSGGTTSSTSKSGSKSSSVSGSGGGGSSESHSLRVTAPLIYDIPLPSFTRLVSWVGQVITISTTTSASSSSSESNSQDSSDGSSETSSSNHSLSSSVSIANNSGGSGGNSKSENKTGSKNGGAQSNETKGETKSVGTANGMGESTVYIKETYDPATQKFTIEKQDITTRITDFNEALGIPLPPVDQPTETFNLPTITDQQFFQNSVETDAPDIIGPVTVTLDGTTSVGLPSSVDNNSETDVDQTGDSEASGGGSGSNDSNSESSASSISQSTSDSGSINQSSSDSSSAGKSKDRSLSSSNSSQSSGDSSKGTSMTFEDVYKITPLIETVVPFWDNSPAIASVSFLVSDLKVWDGDEPTAGFSINLSWTPQGRLQSQRIYRKNTSVTDSLWQFVELNADANSFVDDGLQSWVTGNPPDDSDVPAETCLKLRINGIIDSSTFRTRLGYGQDHWAISPPIALAPVPNSEPLNENQPWYFDVYAMAGSKPDGTLSIKDCYIMPCEQPIVKGEGASFGSNRFGQISHGSGGALKLSPGNNVVVLLAEDENQAPISLEGTGVALKVTPQFTWETSLT